MEIRDIMCKMYNDGVYSAATLWDRPAAQQVIEHMEAYYRDNPTDVYAGLLPETYEERLARGLHDKLYKVAIDAWCRSYTREQMVQLIGLLQIGGLHGTELRLSVCDGGETMCLDEIRSAWNEANNTQEPIYGTDPDIG